MVVRTGMWSWGGVVSGGLGSRGVAWMRESLNISLKYVVTVIGVAWDVTPANIWVFGSEMWLLCTEYVVTGLGVAQDVAHTNIWLSGTKMWLF